MKRLKILAFVLITLTFKVSAESFVYITDQLDLPIRSDKNFGNNIIRLLPSGTELSLLQSTEDGWAQIQFDDTIGWIKSFYLSPDPSAREKLKKLTRTNNANKLLITKLTSEKEELEKQLLSIKEENFELKNGDKNNTNERSNTEIYPILNLSEFSFFQLGIFNLIYLISLLEEKFPFVLLYSVSRVSITLNLIGLVLIFFHEFIPV